MKDTRVPTSAVALCGSPEIEMSIAGVEVIPVGKSLRNFCFVVDNACHVSVNGCGWVHIRQGQVTKLDHGVVYSMKFMQDGITFNWLGEDIRGVKIKWLL